MYNYTPQVPIFPQNTSNDDDDKPYPNYDDKSYPNYVAHKGVTPNSSAFLRKSENIYVVEGTVILPTPASLGLDLWYFLKNIAIVLFIYFGFFISGMNPINTLSALYEHILLSQNPEIVLGRVTELHRNQHSTSSHGKTNTYYTYAVSYEFVINDKIYSSTEDISSSLYANYRIKGAIQVEYIGNNPNISRPVGDSIREIEIFTIVATIILLCFLGWLVIQYIKVTKLCQTGQLIKGNLLSFEVRGGRKNGYRAIVHVSFHPPFGDSISKKISYPIPRSEKDSYVKEGTPIYIYYANKNNWRML